MLCSVVIPTFNRKESLRRSLDALARQTVPRNDFEVIVVSDGSTDGTDAMLGEYARTGALNLRWFTQANAGPAAARNNGIARVQSPIVVFTDDDVEPIPEFLERHMRHHDLDDNIVVLGPLSSNPKWTSGEPVWIAWEHEKLRTIYDLFLPGGRYAGCDAGYEHFYSGNASLRRKWLSQIKGFNTDFKRQEDVEMAWRLKQECGVRFQFDFEADGLHHPVRTLQSWLRIPSTYGALDAERVRTGHLEAETVADLAAQRHGITRALTRFCMAAPVLVGPASLLLAYAATGLQAVGARSAASASLSAVYNARYAVAYAKASHTSAMASPPLVGRDSA